MGSLKSGRKFDRANLQDKIDSPKKAPMTFACLVTTKLYLEEYSKPTHKSTSEFINDILEEVITLYKAGGSIEDIKGAVNLKKTEGALTKMLKEKEQLLARSQTLENELKEQKVHVRELGQTINELTATVNKQMTEASKTSKELLETKENNLLIALPQRAKELYLEQEAFRIRENKNKSATGVFVAMWLKALESSFTKSDSLNPGSEKRKYLEGLKKQYP